MNIGILGGGQLARMLIESRKGKDHRFLVMDSENDSPAGEIADEIFTGDWNNKEDLKAFASKCDVITLENEFIDHNKIKFLESCGIEVNPSGEVLRLVQDKLIQKEFLTGSGIPVAPFTAVSNKNDVLNFAMENNYPLILKSRTMGYDGKGNYFIKDGSQIEEAVNILSERGQLLCEAFIDFDKELAVQAVRNKAKEIKIYPVVETIQEDHICHIVKAVKGKYSNLENEIEKFTIKILNELDYIGVMGIEMFLMKDGSILINELAPRVHNSGHHTIESCISSQFENHINAVVSQPLGKTEMKTDNAVMINIIGRKEHSVEDNFYRNASLKNKNEALHLYGKKQNRKGRKMGHITLTGFKNIDTLTEDAILAREQIKL